ncbi:MAG TPA: LysM peptidoglycan-binding domain-containing protein [Herpetosiphonaceae bacterium]
MSLSQVTIEILDTAVIGGRNQLPQFFTVPFNPTEYTLNKAAQIAEIAIMGIDSPILQFIRGQNEKLTLELFFDTTTTDDVVPGPIDVREKTRIVYQLVKIQPETHAPPRVRVTWGSGLEFYAIVESVQQRFTLFNAQGIPLRATLSVSFREYKSLQKQLRELNLQSSDHTKRYVVKRGETLSQIAARVYHDAYQWRQIADANPGVDPRRPAPGAELIIPPLDDFGKRG